MIEKLHLLVTKKVNVLLILKDAKKEDIISNFFSLSAGNIGLISPRFPLLSNLEVIENSFLPLMYKANISLEQCYQKFLPWIKALDLERVLWLRKEKLTGEEKFRAMFLRALCASREIIFLEYPKPEEVILSFDYLSKLHLKKVLWCLVREEEYSKFELTNFAEKVEI